MSVTNVFRNKRVGIYLDLKIPNALKSFTDVQLTSVIDLT